MASPSLGDSAEGTPQPSMTTVGAQDHQNQPGQFEVDKYKAGHEEIVGAGSGSFMGLSLGGALFGGNRVAGRAVCGRSPLLASHAVVL